MSLVDFLKSKNFLAQDEKPSISRLRTVLREYLQTVLTIEQYQAFSDMLNFCDVEDGNKFLMLGYYYLLILPTIYYDHKVYYLNNSQSIYVLI